MKILITLKDSDDKTTSELTRMLWQIDEVLDKHSSIVNSCEYVT